MLTELELETIHIAVDLFSHLPTQEIKQLQIGMTQLFEERRKIIAFPLPKLQYSLNN